MFKLTLAYAATMLLLLGGCSMHCDGEALPSAGAMGDDTAQQIQYDQNAHAWQFYAGTRRHHPVTRRYGAGSIGLQEPGGDPPTPVYFIAWQRPGEDEPHRLVYICGGEGVRVRTTPTNGSHTERELKAPWHYVAVKETGESSQPETLTDYENDEEEMRIFIWRVLQVARDSNMAPASMKPPWNANGEQIPNGAADPCEETSNGE